MFETAYTVNGRKTVVRFLTPETARIRIAPEYVKKEDSGLNRYEFINEPSREFPVTGKEMSVSSDALTVTIGKDGLVRAEDGRGKTLFSMTGARMDEEMANAVFTAQKDEDWIGFGDQTRERLFHRGHKAVCWVSNVVSYLPVPFFASTCGYGILVNTTHQIIFDMCESDPDRFSWADERGVIDFYVFAAPSFKEIIALYTELTGKPKLPPEWAFGLWYICRTQANDREVVGDAVNFRREGIPCDLIGLEPGWMETNYDFSTEKDWSRERFSLQGWQKECDQTFIKALKRLGFHLELWLCQNYDLSLEEERRIHSRVQGKKDGKAVFARGAEQDLHFAAPVYLDNITKRDEPWFEHLKNFVDWGADSFKQDGSAQVCTHPDRFYGNGMTDSEMHNLYPLIYSRQMWEGFAAYTNRRPVVFTVSGWAGFQAWCGTWTGDTGGRLETLGAMLNTSVMGHCWATNDMEVLQKEGVHFGYLQPWSQINSWTYFRMPWLQGEEILNMHKFYARFRARLIPYIYSQAYQSTKSGVPLMLPLFIEFQDEKETRTLMHEYLLGHDLLVSIYKDEAYFPTGKWKDFWTGEVISGRQTRKISWPADRGGGLFVREGAIIPFGPLMQYRKERPLDEIDLYVFPSEKETEFFLYEDDGVSFDYLQGKFALTSIRQKKEKEEKKEEKMGKETVRISIGTAAASEVKKWSLTVAMDKVPAKAWNNGTLIPADLLRWDAVRRELKISSVQPGEVVIDF